MVAKMFYPMIKIRNANIIDIFKPIGSRQNC